MTWSQGAARNALYPELFSFRAYGAMTRREARYTLGCFISRLQSFDWTRCALHDRRRTRRTLVNTAASDPPANAGNVDGDDDGEDSEGAVICARSRAASVRITSSIEASLTGAIVSTRFDIHAIVAETKSSFMYANEKFSV